MLLLIGRTGLEIRSGKLVVNGGKIVGNGIPVSVEANGSGSTTVGAGIAITQHTTKKNLDVIITGGTIEGYSAVYQSNPEKNEDEAIEKVSIKISGGTFKTLNNGTLSIYSVRFRGNIPIMIVISFILVTSHKIRRK